MRSTTVTLIIGIFAAASAIGAAWFYPWPVTELTSDRVNKPLFEAFDSQQVRGIDVVMFNDSRQAIERMALDRKGEKWTLPGFGNFQATNIQRISAIINSLSDCRVLQIESDKQQDHLKYGVLDPDDAESINNPGGMGRKVNLLDRNRRILASLIVGEALVSQDGQLKRFVRIPGEPQVYVVDFEVSALATQLMDWIDPNLVQLQVMQNGPGFPFRSMAVENYRIVPDKLADSADLDWQYRSRIGLRNDELALESLERRSDDDWVAVTPNPRRVSPLQVAVTNLPQMYVSNIRSKGTGLTRAMRTPDKAEGASAFQPAVELGFRQFAATGLPVEFRSTGGQVAVTFANGLRVNVLFGNVAAAQSESKLARWVMLYATVATDILVEPTPPSSADGQLTEDQQRQFARDVAQWKERVQLAQQAANDFNQLHAPWFYAIDEDIVSRLRPDLPIAD